jgi:glycosyltransferase involved in cell wall biosynthesis
VVSTHHGDLVLPPGIINSIIRRVMFQLFKFMAKRAHRLIAYSHDYADNSYYLKPFRNKVSVIYPPIQMPDPDLRKATELHAQWSYEGGPVLGFSGRFVQEKRPDLLIKALEVINTKYPDARIVFAGEYDIKYENTWKLHKDLVAQYRNQLIFLGLLRDNQDMANFYAAIDVLVLPSDNECFALVQVEAMMCGTPVVMTNTPGGRVPVTLTGMGKIVPMGDSEAIGHAVLDICAEPEKYAKSKECILRTFNFDETVNRYERQFLTAAARSRVKLPHWTGQVSPKQREEAP